MSNDPNADAAAKHYAAARRADERDDTETAARERAAGDGCAQFANVSNPKVEKARRKSFGRRK